MIDCSSGDAFGVLSCQFWNTVLQCGVRLPIHTLNYWTTQSVVPAFQLVACLTVIFSIVDLWQCCVCCTRSGVTRCIHFVALYLCLCASLGYTWYFDPISVYFRTFISLSVSLCNDLVDPVFDGVGLAGFKSRSNAFLLAQQLLLFCLHMFSLSLFFLYRLVVWVWGLWTNRVSIFLSRPCIANLF